MANSGRVPGAVGRSLDEHAPRTAARMRRPAGLRLVNVPRMVLVPPDSFYSTRRPQGQKTPAAWMPHSAGFAIRSPRGIGEPQDKRASAFLTSESGSNMQPAAKLARGAVGHCVTTWTNARVVCG